MSPARRLAAGMAAIYSVGMVCAGTAQTITLSSGQPASRSPTLPAAADLAATAESFVPAAGSGSTTAAGVDLLDLLQSRYLELAQKGCAAVVLVNAAVRSNTGDAAPTPYVWSGFFIGRNGDIITNNARYLQNAMQVWVDYNGVKYPADVVGCDPVTDVGLLHLSVPPKDFEVLDLTEVTDLPPKGTMLVAVTSKLGQPPGPSPGIVQGYNANVGEHNLPTVNLRVNIPDDGGEGGSPVLDLHGRLIGMISASLRDSRSSLVLPARAVLRIRDELLATGHVTYGLFGFDVEANTSAETAPQLVVKSVDYGGPALAAGLKAGDVLRSVGGVVLQSNDDLRQVWFFSHPGQDLALVVQRDKSDIQLTLHVGEMPVAAAALTTSVADPPADESAKGAGDGNSVLLADPPSTPAVEQPVPPVEKKSP
jgi:serine protease Do